MAPCLSEQNEMHPTNNTADVLLANETVVKLDIKGRHIVDRKNIYSVMITLFPKGHTGENTKLESHWLHLWTNV